MAQIALVLLATQLVAASPTASDSGVFDDYEAELGRVRGVVLVVDGSREGLGRLGMTLAQFREQTMARLSDARVRVLSEAEAMESMRGVLVLHVSVDVVVHGRARLGAVVVKVDARRQALVDFCRNAPLVIVWSSGEVGLYPLVEAGGYVRRLRDKHVELFLGALRRASHALLRACDSCQSVDGASSN